MTEEREPSQLEVIAAAFATPAQTMAAHEDLGRWIERRDHDASLFTRRRGDSPNVTLVIVVVLADSGHHAPIIRRLRRKGGQLTEIPGQLEQELVEVTLDAIDQAGA